MPRATKTDDLVRNHAPDLTGFDYNAPGEVFLSRSRASKSRPKYKRFGHRGGSGAFCRRGFACRGIAGNIPVGRRSAVRGGRDSLPG